MRRSALKFDVVVAADFRTGDTGAGTAVGYVRALAAAGYSVAVMQVFGSAAARMPLHPGWATSVAREDVAWIAAGTPCRARLLLAVDLRIFCHRCRETPAVEAGRRIVVVTRAVRGPRAAAAAHLAHAREFLGAEPTLAPAAAPLRAFLAARLPEAELAWQDCPPAIHPLEAPPEPRAARVTMPALGYFRADADRPWPAVPGRLRQILPAHPLIALKLLAAPAEVEAALEGNPAPVEYRSDRGQLARFLAGIDLLASGDDPEDDPHPPEIVAALRAGVVPLLPPGYRGIFLSAAAYAAPDKAESTILDLFAAPDVIEDFRAAGREVLEGIFAPERFLQQVAHWIGPPGSHPVHSAGILRRRRRILSLSTNGIGMGHLSRQLAVAERLRPGIETVFLGLSQSVGVVRRYGYLSEHIPFFEAIGLESGYWNRALAQHLLSAVDFYDAAAIMLDANHPFAGLQDLRARHPGLPMVWMRRGLWRRDHDTAPLDRAPLFDLVLEPGEIAAAYDDGPTASRPEAVRLAPVRLVDPGMQLSRAAACRDIGLSPDGLNVLLMPGAQNNFDAGGLWARVLAEVAAWPGATPVLGEWTISRTEHPWPAAYPRMRGFPYARWFPAFDLAVSAAGYNSFTDLVSLGLPAVFVPNENPSMDRQELRAAYAARHGLGAALRADAPGRVAQVLAPFRAAGFRSRMAEAQRAAFPGNGAADAARLVAELVHGAHAHRPNAWSP